MEQQRKEEYTRKYIMHMLHLEKLGRIRTEDNSKERDEKSFFCYGYYDRMTYIADKEKNPFTYEHAFSIKYPYEKSIHPIIADQLFTLLEPVEGDYGRGDNPFLVKDEAAPFLGVFLITISLLEKCEKENFCLAVEAWCRKLSEMLNRICGEKEIFQIYESPNCADLCLVIRTGELDKICEIERALENGEDVKDNSDKQGLRYTLYIASWEEDALDKAEPLKANKEQKIEIRFQCEENIQKSLVSCLKSMANSEQDLNNQASQIENYLVNGKGDYSLIMGYPLFAKVYPYYLAAKLGINVAGEKAEWRKNLSDLLGKCTFAYERWYLHISQENKDELNNSKIDSDSSRDLDKNFPWEEMCSKMQQSVDALKEYGECLANSDMLMPYSNNMICTKRRFEEQCRMIKDLLYTYENLWFDKSTVPEGRIFYAQISALIEGIYQQICLIKEVQKDMERTEGIAGRWDIENLLIIVNDLIENMYIMISGINNFNRLIQAVNQNLRNVPNYEMHSKVNVEKYLYAYTMYLMNICKKYYKKSSNDGTDLSLERIFPIVIIGMSHGKISAQTLFRSLEDSENNNDRQSVFLVQCPNYHRFANIYHVLPMITHEISHCFRYEKRETRNKFLVGYFVGAVVENLADRLAEEEYRKNNLYTWKGAVNFLYATIANQMKPEVEKLLKKDLSHTHLSNMKAACLDKIWKCLDAEDPNYTSGRKLWGICRDNFEELYTLCGIGYVTPEDMMNSPETHIYDALFNLLFDILKEDDSRLNEWEQWSKNVDMQNWAAGQAGTESEIVEQMCDIISRYQSKKAVLYDDMYCAMQMFTKRMWKKILGEDGDVYQQLKSGGYKEAFDNAKKADKLIMNENPLIFDESSEFKEYFAEIKRALNWKNDEAASVKRRIWEICLLAIEILQAWTVYGKGSVCAPKKKHEEFLEKVHKKLYKEYHKKCANQEKNPWIIAKDVQRMYVSLGIVNRSPDQFISRVKTTLHKLDRSQIEALLRDKLKLYGEVFADLGMCKVFGFDACGYFTYTIHLFMKERELAVRDAYNMSAERMKLVIYVLWMSSERENIKDEDVIKRNSKCFEKWVGNYKTEIENYKSKLGVKKDGIDSDLSELNMHERMLVWMEELTTDMELPVWKETYKDFLDYAKRIYCEQMEFMEIDDLIVSSIGEHYNKFTDIGNGMTANSQNIMDVQNQFVLSYYGKMQDASANISTMDMESKPGVDFAKQYNLKFMGWTGDKK